MTGLTKEERDIALYKGIVGILLLSIAILGSVICCQRNKINELKETTSPVKELVILDSLNKVNTKLVIEVELLDSIKDVEKDKILTLSNDSTLKLFYELLRKE